MGSINSPIFFIYKHLRSFVYILAGPMNFFIILVSFNSNYHIGVAIAFNLIFIYMTNLHTIGVHKIIDFGTCDTHCLFKEKKENGKTH